MNGGEALLLSVFGQICVQHLSSFVMSLRTKLSKFRMIEHSLYWYGFHGFDLVWA
jgi:hypothetical protein